MSISESVRESIHVHNCGSFIDQFTLDGRHVKRWTSTRAIADEFKCSVLTARRACHFRNSRKLGMFIWKFVKRDAPVPEYMD